jgi:hypothetical protein
MQGKQDPLPSVGFLDPARHFKHVLASSEPPRYSPKPQLSHPFVAEFSILPAAHSLHDDAFVLLVRPDAHESHAFFRSISAEKVFKAHGLHASLPFSFWYSPGIHGRQYGAPSID